MVRVLNTSSIHHFRAEGDTQAIARSKGPAEHEEKEPDPQIIADAGDCSIIVRWDDPDGRIQEGNGIDARMCFENGPIFAMD